MRSKYNAQKIYVDGIRFDSKAEARRYRELKQKEERGEISLLSLQPQFTLQEKFRQDGKTYRAITYKADFMYYDNVKKRDVVEDVKGVKTEAYKIKAKMFRNRYPNVLFREVKA